MEELNLESSSTNTKISRLKVPMLSIVKHTHRHHTSHVAGLMLCLVLCVCVSAGWTFERVQEYFIWANEVVKGLRGTNSALEEKLDELFRQRGIQLWLIVFETHSQIKYTLLNYTNKAYFLYVYVVPVCLYSKGLLEFDKILSLDSEKIKKTACLSVCLDK